MLTARIAERLKIERDGGSACGIFSPAMARTNLTATNFRTAFVLILVLVVSILFLAVVWPFFTPLLLAAVVASLSRPLYNYITRLLGHRPSLGALVTLLILFLLLVGPLSAFVGVVVNQALEVSTQAIPWVQNQIGSARTFDPQAWVEERFPALVPYLPAEEKVMETIANTARAVGGFLVAGLSRMTTGTAVFLLDLFVMFYAMFFFLRDGGKIVQRVFYFMPLRHQDEARLLERFTSVTRATIKGTFIIGIIQGALAGIGFWAAGITGAAFWGTLMAILSILPGVGSALIWVPGVIYLYLAGKGFAATMLLIWCAAIVGTVDNFLRPRLVGKDAKIPDLLILIGTLGGLYLFGAVGIIVGPIICGLFLTVWEIYGALFRDILPPVRDLEFDKSQMPPAIPEEATPPART